MPTSATHAPSGSPITQYARYGNQDRVVGPDASEKSKTRRVAVARSDSRTVYKWRIDLAGDLDVDRAIVFDVSVSDKDSSFSWAAWGSGTQKIASP